ncbi:transmembrane amino acid transporter [Nitzschia inconspicua]|uniref:Transmembrane amino acid transporter n=1 Tax=Nitzschia inconspicua TaxID=303405 RepID=A0A9K3L0J5_9STRA|nr:transmembrane amino acid transporter [Nitzschia inconspicua]KAG7359528.1 transmembrane amino acid transporter [Nitzschia inconspicua]
MPTTDTLSSSTTTTHTAPKSPFFQPSEKSDYTQTPGGTVRRRVRDSTEVEHKSTIIGCSANLINAIVGSGIVGLPYAVKEAGFCAGVLLVILCGFLTEKSLRLLVETAKHAHVPSYETVTEAAFGKVGFLFVAINMFMMAYGAMLSYLMIVKDTFSDILGIAKEDLAARRALLVGISMLIMVPLSSQRDVADLVRTSRINVTFDFIMVCLVLYLADLPNTWKTFDWTHATTTHVDTMFVGLGVLSFAFVCQHSAFIIAGSLENPTRSRWSSVTHAAVGFAACLSLAMGAGGYIGFKENTQGNILNSLPQDSALANIARGFLGTTMLFVYPMESFVARHACVVLFFQGRTAHEGDDTSVLNRRDRRITLTFVLYLLAVIPAAIFENLGSVLAATGAVAGSCLSYIGPGLVYIGIHGERFLELSYSFFGHRYGFLGSHAELPATHVHCIEEHEVTPLYRETTKAGAIMSYGITDSWFLRQIKNVAWYLLGMPLWCTIASFGKKGLISHVTKMALQSPHPIRIGNVRFARTTAGGDTGIVLIKQEYEESDTSQEHDVDVLPVEPLSKDGNQRTSGGKVGAFPVPKNFRKGAVTMQKDLKRGNYQSINQRIGAVAKRQTEEEKLAIEDDPQQKPPATLDFVIAIFYIAFGAIAMAAGLLSIFIR